MLADYITVELKGTDPTFRIPIFSGDFSSHQLGHTIRLSAIQCAVVHDVSPKNTVAVFLKGIKPRNEMNTMSNNTFLTVEGAEVAPSLELGELPRDFLEFEVRDLFEGAATTRKSIVLVLEFKYHERRALLNTAFKHYID